MSTTYRVTVVTGSAASAGTDADVYITLYGVNGNSGERLLDNAEDNFERRKTDIFTFDARELGQLRRVRIRHDNSGKKPGWFLDKITIHNDTTDQEWAFPCGKWLAYDEDDGLIERMLPAV